jgi:enamine deaminase RidA (YjgF/YER057c/UK114 family)
MIQGEGPLALARLPLPRLAGQSQAWLDRVLGGILFGDPSDQDAASRPPELCAPSVALPLLTGESQFCELWMTTEALESGSRGRIRYRRGRSVLFGYLSASEVALSSESAPGAPPLLAATEAAYLEIFDCLEALGFPTVARFWNYLPDINRVTHGVERYRQFNIGRQNAFLAHQRTVVGAAPPACALGCSSGSPLSVIFLATSASVSSIANPRQINAFEYPRDYGPRTPTFSRAGLLELGGQPSLFVSGTSSIVGHATRHMGDAAAQTRETMTNIAAVVAAANETAGGAAFRMDEMRYNAYVRHPGDLNEVRAEIEHKLGADTEVAYLQADICRADLLVEVEAFGGPLRPG